MTTCLSSNFKNFKFKKVIWFAALRPIEIECGVSLILVIQN